jgi:hypothetical protein
MTAMFLDNNDALFLFGDNSNNPYAFRHFNDIMRQYYDSNGNPIKQQQQINENMSQNVNREIVSSVQPTNTNANTNTNRTTIKRDTLTLNLLLPKNKNEKKTGEEVLASEHLGKGNRSGSKDNFDIRDYISRVYDYENRQQQRPQQQQNNNRNKLTLAHLLNARRRKTRTFIFAKESDY